MPLPPRSSRSLVVLALGAVALAGCAESGSDPVTYPDSATAGSGPIGPITAPPDVPPAETPDAPPALAGTPGTAPDIAPGAGPDAAPGPAVSGPAPGLLFDPSIADLDSVALELRLRVLESARATLAGLNADYVAGTLDEQGYDCAGPDWPTLEYFCGGENGSGAPLAYGREVHSFAFADDPACREAVVSGATDLPACTVEFVHLAGDEDREIRYRLRFVAGALVERIDIALGGSEVSVDPDLAPGSCSIEYVASALVYSDENACDDLVRGVYTG